MSANFRFLPVVLSAAIAGLLAVAPIEAAVPGLPFTEDFADTEGRSIPEQATGKPRGFGTTPVAPYLCET